jgi:imidazolonepropionase-like amidohydrolase
MGPRTSVDAPAGVPVYRAAAVTPGLIDAHSLVGLSGLYNVPADQDQDESVEPNQAALKALDGFNPAEPLLAYLLSQGITVIQCGPGREAPIAGQAGIFRTRGRSAEEMALRFPSAMVLNLGEEPKHVFGSKRKSPATRMGTAAVIRAALSGASTYAAKQDRAAASPDKDPPDRDPRAEALGACLSGKLPVIFSARREDDILTALRLTREFKLRSILDLATEGYLIADQIAASGLPVIAAPTMERVGALETMNASFENAALLRRAGIRVAIQSGFEDYVPKTRVIRLEAAVAAANGLGFTGALRAITIDAAGILQIEDRFGSLAPGKTADLVLYDGDPFEYTTRVTRVIMDGKTAYAP